MSIQSKLTALIQLARIDGEFAGPERQFIYMIGKAHRMKEAEIDDLVNNPVPLPDLGTLTEEDKFEYLYHLVQLMKIDSQVYLSEIRYCEDLAEKLGFKKKVIGALSKRIFSDPSITSDIDSLKSAVKKYKV